jgi:hypothetical protein
MSSAGEGGDEAALKRRTAVNEYRKKLLQHKELDSRLRTGKASLSLSISLLFERRSMVVSCS